MAAIFRLRANTKKPWITHRVLRGFGTESVGPEHLPQAKRSSLYFNPAYGLEGHHNNDEDVVMSNAFTPHVVIYTTPTCPDCRMLKDWLNRAGVAFEERDLTDPATRDEAKARTGVRVAPITLVDERVFYGTFASQKPGLVEALGLSNTA